MADRTSAFLFRKIFDHLAGRDCLDPEAAWALTRDYDFSPEQMHCDEALLSLGLAEKCKHGQIFYRDGYEAHEVCDDCLDEREARRD